jgi:hypothetical protein
MIMMSAIRTSIPVLSFFEKEKYSRNFSGSIRFNFFLKVKESIVIATYKKYFPQIFADERR